MQKRMITATLAFAGLAFGLVGCGSARDDGGVAASVGALGKARSAFTPMAGDNCKTLEQDEEAAGYIRYECDAPGDYKLISTHTDLRSWLTLRAPDYDYDLPVPQYAPEGGAFSELGPVADWRFDSDDPEHPYAVIARVAFDVPSDTPPDYTRRISYLSVTRITPEGACLDTLINASRVRGANQLAHEIADAHRGQPCVQMIVEQPADPNDGASEGGQA